MAIVLHLLPANDWLDTAHLAPVVNTSLDLEGFIHCTDDHDVLLKVANAFYTSDPGDFMVLHVDTERLLSPCVWEAPAHLKPTQDVPATLFPHIYGVIDRQAIIATQTIVRDSDHQFVGFGEIETEVA
jgi:uncharacterized protein